MIPAPHSPAQPHLLRLPNWLGDVVMALPLLRALRASRPDAEITLVVRAQFADEAAGLESVGRRTDARRREPRQPNARASRGRSVIDVSTLVL